jgi:hypothetical protein
MNAALHPFMTEHPQGTDRQLLQQAGLSRPKPMSKQPTFNCTACGQCCHNLKLPLGIAEAVDWLRRGGQGASHLRGHSLGGRARRGRRGGGAQAVYLVCCHERAVAHPGVGLPRGLI